MSEDACKNTDRELFREGGGDGNGMSYYEPHVSATTDERIQMHVGGTVYSLPIREWHALAGARYGGPRMTENPTTAGLSEAERSEVENIVTYKAGAERAVAIVERIITAHVTAAEDRMREAVDPSLRLRLLPVLDRAVEFGDLTRDEAFGVLDALAPTAHDEREPA